MVLSLSILEFTNLIFKEESFTTKERKIIILKHLRNLSIMMLLGMCIACAYSSNVDAASTPVRRSGLYAYFPKKPGYTLNTQTDQVCRYDPGPYDDRGNTTKVTYTYVPYYNQWNDKNCLLAIDSCVVEGDYYKVHIVNTTFGMVCSELTEGSNGDLQVVATKPLFSTGVYESGNNLSYMVYGMGEYGLVPESAYITNIYTNDNTYKVCSHNYNITVSNATCSAAKVVKCSDCGATKTVGSALGHSWGNWVTTKAATVYEEGSMKRTCTRDKSHTEAKVIPKKNFQIFAGGSRVKKVYQGNALIMNAASGSETLVK